MLLQHQTNSTRWHTQTHIISIIQNTHIHIVNTFTWLTKKQTQNDYSDYVRLLQCMSLLYKIKALIVIHTHPDNADVQISPTCPYIARLRWAKAVYTCSKSTTFLHIFQERISTYYNNWTLNKAALMHILFILLSNDDKQQKLWLKISASRLCDMKTL